MDLRALSFLDDLDNEDESWYDINTLVDCIQLIFGYTVLKLKTGRNDDPLLNAAAQLFIAIAKLYYPQYLEDMDDTYNDNSHP